MRLYIDNNYQPAIFEIISKIQSLQLPQEYEVIYREWKEDFKASDTIVFLVNLNKKTIDRSALQYFSDGYKVFIYRKPYDAPFNSYNQALIIISHWRKILNTIKENSAGCIYSINNYKVERLK